jgi:diguanylate cyclase (GGDEF)-like protein/PAS domain S-box-containing protein
VSKPELTQAHFQRRFRNLILLAWTIPPVFGLSFLLYIRMFTPSQMMQVLASPLEPGFIIVSLAFALWYFRLMARPIADYLAAPDEEKGAAALSRVRSFPVHFWGVFLIYLLLAPSTVIYSAELFANFAATPVDWFRIHLVALIVSILVGLPIFFSLFNLFGLALQGMRLDRPMVTIRTKVFLIGALVPLLVDTMLVQYYWTRTGYFTIETFVIWAFLQVLAIAGAMMFVRSFGQSLRPLEDVVEGQNPLLSQQHHLQALSTDELGVLTGRYGGLLEHLHFQGQTLAVGNRVLRSVNTAATIGEAYDKLVEICRQALNTDMAFLVLRGEGLRELVGVSQTGASYNPAGHFCLSLDEPSLAVTVFNEGKQMAIEDVTVDPRISPRMRHKYQLGSAIAAPLIAEDTVIGVILASTQQYQRRYSAQDNKMMNLLAREAAAVVHAQLLEEKRQQAELLYQEAHQLAQVTLQSISDGVVTADTNGQVVYLNPVAEQLTGWTLDQARGRMLAQVVRLMDETSGEALVDPVALCLENAERLNLPGPILLLNKTEEKEFPVEVRVSPLREPDGQLQGVALVFNDTSELNVLSRRLTYQASHDALTGLINRHEFEAQLDLALSNSLHEKRQHALCYLDLDQFKVINDTCGHVAGDELLKQLAVRLRAVIRETDTVARLGGDEFGLLLEDYTLPQAQQVASKLLEMARDYQFSWGDKSFSVGLSIGLVPITADSGDITDLLSAADSACYMAKSQGRNRMHIFEKDDLTLARHRGEMLWLQEIREALQGDRFQLFHQRIQALDAAEAGREASEILLRLEGENGEIILPNTFLPVAERYHLMPAIDRWVVRHALRHLRAQGHNSAPVHYSINLSAQSLSENEFLDFVLQELADSGAPAEQVCFEITETTAIANLNRAMRFITELKAQGCRFALDDFGSGLSSFAYLKNLPVDYLKIDGSFVKDIDTNRVDRAMVEAINEIGHLMGIKTVAEFAVSAEVMAVLEEIGVDYVQGFHIARPVALGPVTVADDNHVQGSS